MRAQTRTGRGVRARASAGQALTPAGAAKQEGERTDKSPQHLAPQTATITSPRRRKRARRASGSHGSPPKASRPAPLPGICWLISGLSAQDQPTCNGKLKWTGEPKQKLIDWLYSRLMSREITKDKTTIWEHQIVSEGLFKIRNSRGKPYGQSRTNLEFLWLNASLFFIF